jgi:ketosteroid isomerase-like protein
MASKAKMIGSSDPTQPETAVEEKVGLRHSTREQEIRNRAFEIYLQRGGQPGYELGDWLQAERELSTNLTALLQQLLQNTSNLKVLMQLMTPDATYVSLNFNNPELKKIEPWAGTHKGPQALSDVFAAIQRSWKTLDFKITDTIEQGSRVALFGSFTYKSNVTGKEITSPFSLLARFEGDKVAYVQFLEDSYGTAGSFKTGGTTRFHSDPSGKEVEV